MRNRMTRWTVTSAMLMLCVLVATGSMGCGGFPITVIIDDTETCFLVEDVETECTEELLQDCFEDFFGFLVCEEPYIEVTCIDIPILVEICE